GRGRARRGHRGGRGGAGGAASAGAAMTRRGAALLLAPLPLLALSALAAPLRWAAAALVVAALAVVAVDGRRAPSRARLHARREHDDPLSVGRSNPVRLRL